jgi:hypothetical protein
MLKRQSYLQSGYNSGKNNEEYYKPIIEKDTSNFNLLDFENANFIIELKTREVTIDAYETRSGRTG